MDTNSNTLTEPQVIQGFHLLLKHALSHSTQEGLVKEEELQSGNADIQVVGPSLTLYFAALLAKGTPPSISSPDNSFLLSSTNCPPSFLVYFNLWQSNVPQIQKLDEEGRQDLTLLLCEKEPKSSPLRADIVRMSNDLKSVAIEIAQRRTFALRFGEDLDHALNVNRPRGSGETARSSGFVPPPDYVPDPSAHNHDVKVPGGPGSAQTQAEQQHSNASDSTPTHLPPLPPRPHRPTSNDVSTHSSTPPNDLSASSSASAAQLSPADLENLSLIRETLFASFADCFATEPFLSTLFSRGPSWMSRALFSTLNLAILEVCEARVTAEGVKAVQVDEKASRVITLENCPVHLRPFFLKLLDLGEQVRKMASEDDERAMKDAENGRETVGRSKLERLKAKLVGDDEDGNIGQEEEEQDRRRESLDDQVARISNEINRLAIAMIELPSFAARSKSALQVLTAVNAL